jgi:hypothetical protein
MPPKKTTRLRQTSILTLPANQTPDDQPDKDLFVYFPAQPGSRINPNTTQLLIQHIDRNGDVLRTWSPRHDRRWTSSPSPFGSTARVFGIQIKLDPPVPPDPPDPPEPPTPEPPKPPTCSDPQTPVPPCRTTSDDATGDRITSGDLILVTVTITVPPTATEPEAIVETFEIEAVTIDFP